MDREKISKFLKEIREKNGLSQEELADKLYVTRQAISAWESGKNYPHLETLNQISKIFNISLISLISGEEVNDKEKENEIIYTTIKKEQNKTKKVLITFITIIVLLLLTFFVYYFINTYRRTSIYRITADETGVIVSGIFINTKSQNYLNLSIKEKDIKELSLYYKDKLIDGVDSNSITFQESYGYNEYYSYEKDFTDNLTLKIVYKDDTLQDAKIRLTKDFENKELFFKKTESISEENSESWEYNKVVPEKIKKEFKENEYGNYSLILNKGKVILSYITDAQEFTVSIQENNIRKDFDYAISSYGYNSFWYSEYDTEAKKELYKFSSYEDDINDEKIKKITDYYMDNYVNKYIN